MEIGVASNNQKVLLNSQENKIELQVMKVVVGVEGGLWWGGCVSWPLKMPMDSHWGDRQSGLKSPS